MANTLTMSKASRFVIDGHAWVVDRVDMRSGKIAGVGFVAAADWADPDTMLINGFTAIYYSAAQLRYLYTAGALAAEAE